MWWKLRWEAERVVQTSQKDRVELGELWVDPVKLGEITNIM